MYFFNIFINGKYKKKTFKLLNSLQMFNNVKNIFSGDFRARIFFFNALSYKSNRNDTLVSECSEPV